VFPDAHWNLVWAFAGGGRLTGIWSTPSVAWAIEKRNKALNIMVLDRATAKEELFKKQAEETEKVRRKSKGNRTVQKYGTIYAGDARLKTIARNES
jgi:hypothetical protein